MFSAPVVSQAPAPAIAERAPDFGKPAPLPSQIECGQIVAKRFKYFLTDPNKPKSKGPEALIHKPLGLLN